MAIGVKKKAAGGAKTKQRKLTVEQVGKGVLLTCKMWFRGRATFSKFCVRLRFWFWVGVGEKGAQGFGA